MDINEDRRNEGNNRPKVGVIMSEIKKIPWNGTSPPVDTKIHKEIVNPVVHSLT